MVKYRHTKAYENPDFYQLVFFKRFNFMYYAGRLSLFDMKKQKRLFKVGA